MNFLTEHHIAQYEELESRISEVTTANEQAADALKGVEKRLADMALHIKNVSTYQKTKTVYDSYRKARNPDSYRTAHESSIILHEAAIKALKAMQISGKLPNVAALQSNYAKLQEQKETLYSDYGKLKKQVKEYSVIKQNIDSVLQLNNKEKKTHCKDNINILL